MEITLKYLSQYSGYSKSTISKALNDKQEINELTKAKIKELANQLNYIPNAAAKSLRHRKSSTIAVIVPQINDRYYSNILAVIQIESVKRGYRLMVYQSFNGEKKELECFNNVSEGCVDGVIYVNKLYQKGDLINSLLESSKINYVSLFAEKIGEMLIVDINIKAEKSVMSLIHKINESKRY